jgi:acyl-CoA reductase-like NAD-dependent aldehyde dehydrogenase
VSATETRHGLLVAGRREEGAGEPLEVRYPYTGELVATVERASDADADRALEAAQAAFAEYRSTPSHRRAALLHGASARVAARREELARQITLETGKAIWESRVEVDRAVTTLRLAAEEATRIDGEIVPLDGVPAGEGRYGEVRRFPLGPVVAVTPFNSPLNLVCHKVGPALAAGNTIVVKPSEKTPLSGLEVGAIVAEAAADAGVPLGVVGVLPAGPELVEPLVADPRVKAISFTGSSAVGWNLRAKAGHKKVSLELGGNGAVIVHRDADVEYAATRCAFGGFLLAGQVCASVQRVYVHEEVADRFAALLVEAAAEYEPGDPLDEATRMGPMITDAAAERAERWVQEAIAGGAELLCGGTREGRLFRPTVLTGTRPGMRVTCQEVFAPVIVLERYADLDAAIRAANATEYGLQAGIFTADLRVAYRAYRELEAGGVIVNDVNSWRVDSMPYGGVKASGLGREGLRYAIREQMQERLLVLDTEEGRR